MRFHPTRGSMSLSEKDGGLPPDSVVPGRRRDPGRQRAAGRPAPRPRRPGPWSGWRWPRARRSRSPPELMRRTAELAERLDVRLHTHLAEDPDEDTYCLERVRAGARSSSSRTVGWMTDRVLGGPLHLPQPRARSRGWARPGVGVAHCPSSNMMIGGGGLAPVAELRAAGVAGRPRLRRVGVDRPRLALDGGPRRRCCSGRLRRGPERRWRARDALEIATLGGAACLGRQGELGSLAAGRRRRPGLLAARGRRLRRRPRRPGRGLAALRARLPPATPWWPAGLGGDRRSPRRPRHR